MTRPNRWRLEMAYRKVRGQMYTVYRSEKPLLSPEEIAEYLRRQPVYIYTAYATDINVEPDPEITHLQEINDNLRQLVKSNDMSC